MAAKASRSKVKARKPTASAGVAKPKVSTGKRRAIAVDEDGTESKSDHGPAEPGGVLGRVIEKQVRHAKLVEVPPSKGAELIDEHVPIIAKDGKLFRVAPSSDSGSTGSRQRSKR